MNDFILDVLRLFAEYDMCGDSLWWRTNGEYAPVTFLLNCNDLFYWACADAEKITPENLPSLRKAFEDADKAYENGHIWGDQLFIARLRGMRPQGACYKGIPQELWPLFNAAGPERVIDFCNPKNIPEENLAAKEQ